MKDIVTIWRRLLGRTYDSVQTQDWRQEHCPSTSPTRVALRAFNEKQKCAITIAFIGLVGILSGCFVLFVHPYDFLFKWKCVFSDGGEIFEMWRTPEVDLYLRVYLWNITNKEEFMSGVDTKLKMQEVGPYVYRELMSHSNVTFNDNGTLTSIPKHPLVWVPELSEGRREDDLLILPNIALLSIAHVVSDESYFTRLGLNVVIRQTNSEPLVQMTAREFMFGYKSTLMTLGNQFMSSWIYFDKLGLIDRMYEFGGDFETIYTGETDITKTGLIEKYSGSTKIPQWDSPCGDVTGASDGAKFPSYIKPNDSLLFFRKSMCRAKKLVKVNETVDSGFNTYVYHFDPNADDNGKENKNNSCFCKNPGKCLPPGLLDVHGCYYGFPIALSAPHFLNGDPSLNANVEGMNPDPEKHRSFFHIEPQSGLPTQLAARFQINMALGSISTVARTEKFSGMILPLLWTENGMHGLPDKLQSRFKLYIVVLPVVEKGLMYSFFVIGGLFLLYSIWKFVSGKSQKPQFNSPWIEEDDLVTTIERKFSSYIPDKRGSMSTKELEVYLNSLVTPLNQEICAQELTEIKDGEA